MTATPTAAVPTTTMTVTDFAAAVHGAAFRIAAPKLADYSRGNYKGTNIPLKAIPAHTMITVDGHRATDDQGGWVIDRILGDRALLGARQWRAVHGPDAVR